jgi:ATP-binding cassette subfamily A (ABC1) protein 3
MLLIQILTGLSLASWSFFLATPFGKSPVLGAVLSTIISILFAILALVYGPHIGTLGAFFYTLILPSGFYIFAIRNIGAFELLQKPGNLVHPDPSDRLRLLPVVFAVFVRDSFLLLLTP